MGNPLYPNLPLLDLDVLRTFVAISETANFTLAAERVFRTPSAVSMQIKKLEETLGCSVFRRDARSVTLTREGETLLTYARQLLSINNEVVSRFLLPEMSGVVRLGAPDDIGELMLPSILAHFASLYPTLAIDVTIESSTNLRKAVAENRLDLTLFNFVDGIKADPKEKVMSERLVWVGKKNGVACTKNPLPISVWNEGCLWRKRAIEELVKSGREFRIAYYCGHYMGQLAAIRADIAVAPVARFLVSDDMVVLGEREGLPDLGTYDLGMVMREGADAPVHAVADFVRASLAEQSAQLRAA